MRERNYRDIEDINLIHDLIWKSMNVLRGVLPVEHFHVYLFLLSAYYDGVIKSIQIDLNNNIYNSLFSSLENDQNYSKILEVYKPIVESIPEEKLRSILQQFTKLNFEVLDKYFDEIFDDFLFRLADTQGKFSGIFLLPDEISKFVMEIAKTPNQASVFNPFAGLGSFATHLKNGERYYGQEIIKSTWALGMLRLMRQHKYVNIDYRLEDSVHNWPEYENFDLVVSSPPFNFTVHHNAKIKDFGRKYKVATQAIHRDQNFTAEQYVIQKGIQSINPDGKVVCVASMGILFRGGREAGLRKYLIQKGLVDTIVSLPGGLLRHTGIPICVMILTRKINSNSVIRMIDGSDFIINLGKRDKRLDLEKILEAINNDNKKFVRYIPVPQIIEDGYNLNIGRYFIDEVKGISLSEIIIPIQGKKASKGEKGISLRSSSLESDEINYTLNIAGLKNKNIPSKSRRIEESAILISTSWKTLKPTLFTYTGTPIFIAEDILAFKIDDQRLDNVYIINELRSDVVTEQVLAYQSPGAIRSIKQDDLLKIKIDIPSLAEQKAKVRGIQEYAERLKALQHERDLLAHGQEVKSFDEFASLKHSLGAPRQNILSNTKSLIRFFEINNSESFKEVKRLYRERYNNELVEDITQVKEDINHISTILEKGEKGLILSNFDLKPVAIKEIDKVLKRARKSKEKFKPKYDELLDEEMYGKAIMANLTLLKILVDNIISNADKYAFDVSSANNEVIIELKIIEDVMLLEIKNNGLPFPKNFNKEKFSAKYSTVNSKSGTGLGGYDIDRIAGYFNNKDWELSLNKEDIFPVVFKFNFPIIPMINE